MRKQYVYFFQVNSVPIKIGIAYKVDDRLEIARTMNHEKVECIGKFYGGRRVERILHERFKEYKIRGEWFEGVDEIIKIAQKKFDVKYINDNGKFYLVLQCEYENSPTEMCPFYYNGHNHSSGDGHRQPHYSDYLVHQSIWTYDGKELKYEDGYFIKTDKPGINDPNATIRRQKVRRSRIQIYKNILIMAINEGLRQGIFKISDKLSFSSKKRDITWEFNDQIQWKALFRDLGYGEVGISVIINPISNDVPVLTFPYKETKNECEAWATGILRTDPIKCIEIKPKMYSLDMFCSRRIQSTLFGLKVAFGQKRGCAPQK
jgi:hypothetical protein